MSKTFEEIKCRDLKKGDRFKTTPSMDAVYTVYKKPYFLVSSPYMLIPVSFSKEEGAYRDGEEPRYERHVDDVVWREVEEETSPPSPVAGDKVWVKHMAHVSHTPVPFVGTVAKPPLLGSTDSRIWIVDPDGVYDSWWLDDDDWEFPVPKPLAHTESPQSTTKIAKLQNKLDKADERYGELATCVFGPITETDLDTTIRVLQRYRSYIENQRSNDGRS